MDKKDHLRIMLFGHGGSGNRGCEALVRATVSILRGTFGDGVQITLSSFRVEEDIKAGIPYISNYVVHGRALKKWTPSWAWFLFCRKIMGDPICAYRFLHNNTIDQAKKVDVCLSIGGDNYCYGTPYWLYAINRGIKAAGKKLVLWGALIEPDSVDKQMENDLRLFDLLTVRESITYETLKKKGLSNLYLYPDPAFILEKEELPLPAKWQEGNTIGLNISPLVMKYEKRPGIVLRSVHALMKHILEATDSSIALIPHVTWQHDNDLEPLKNLFAEFSPSHRVILIDGRYNASQLKGFISRCRLFIGARTHSIIAAYSTGVPALTLGYSVKARGIARDIFGTESLVLPVQRLNSEKDLLTAFEGLRERENELREHMRKIMPSYIKAAWQAGEVVRKLVTEGGDE